MTITEKPEKPGVVVSHVRKLVAQQREAAFGESHRAVAKDIQSGFRRLIESMKPRANPVVTTFEEAVARQRLTTADLNARFAWLRNAQLCMYAATCLLAFYATWLLINVSIGAFVSAAACCVALVVRGYLYGFRAWQIKERRLATLQEAVRDSTSYLVL